MPWPDRSRNKNGRIRKKRSDAGVPRGPYEPKSEGERALSSPGVGPEREVDFIEEVETKAENGKWDEETECYYVRGLECVNQINEESLKMLLEEGSEISVRPTDYETCSNCLKGLIVQGISTIIINIPNFIPLIEIQLKGEKTDK